MGSSGEDLEALQKNINKLRSALSSVDRDGDGLLNFKETVQASHIGTAGGKLDITMTLAQSQACFLHRWTLALFARNGRGRELRTLTGSGMWTEV
eukprot:754402-Hanusia_phi.AAC.6